jgi:hypothetical protein
VAIAPQFRSADGFRNDLAQVRLDEAGKEKLAYINLAGKFVWKEK